MNSKIKDHIVPIGVTVIGLTAAVGFASAPLLLAESEYEQLTKQNANDIQKIISSTEESSLEFQRDINGQLENNSVKFGSLENQIHILNKAVSNLHRKQNALSSPSGEFPSALASLEKNADARLLILEKAVTRLNKKSNQILASAQEDTGSDNGDDLRLINLEKAVTRLNIRSKGLMASRQDAAEPDQEGDISLSDLENADSNAALRLTNLEKAVSNLNKKQVAIASVKKSIDNSAAVINSAGSSDSTELGSALDSLKRELQLTRLISRSPSSINKSSDENEGRDKTRLNRLNGKIDFLEQRVDEIERDLQRRQRLVTEQLIDLRDYIDILTDDAGR